MHDDRLARVIEQSLYLPGYELFQYIDEDGERHPIDAEDVNEHLQETGGEGFTAKDFRTWSGTVLAAWALREMGRFDSEAQAKRNIVRAVESVAEELGNTPAVYRACYFHPALIDAYLDGDVVRRLRLPDERPSTSEDALSDQEAAVLALLRRRLAAEERAAS